LAFSDVSHYKTDETGNVTLAEGAPDGAVRALQSVKKKVRTYGGGEDDEPVTETETELRLWDKPGMLKLAGRHVGLFPDRVEISGPNGGPIQTQEMPKTSADMRKELAALTGKKDVGTR